jgi:hypothetical protein
MADCELEGPKSDPSSAIERLLTLAFLTRRDNVIVVAASSQLDDCQESRPRGYPGRSPGAFLMAADLILDFTRHVTARARSYLRSARSPLTRAATWRTTRTPELLFQLVNRRYEQKSILHHEELALQAAGTALPNAPCAVP